MPETAPRWQFAGRAVALAQRCAFGLLVLLVSCRKDPLQSCTDLLEGKRYAAAVVRCESVYAASKDARAGAAAARAHFFLGHGDQVVAWASRLTGSSAEAGPWDLAGKVYEQRGETELSERAYRRAVALHLTAGDHRRAAGTYYNLFLLCWSASRYRESFELANRAAEEADKSGDSQRRQLAADALYTVLYAVGDLDGARRALDAVSRLADSGDRFGQARFLSNRGNLLLEQGRLALARRDLERALELAPQDEVRRFFRGVHLNLVQLHLDRGEIAQAANHVEKAAQYLEPDEPLATSLLYYRARVDLARGRYGVAAATLKQALGADPPADWAWDLEYQLGRAEEARGDLRQAEAAYERSAEIVEEMRRSLSFDDLKSWLLDRKRQPFESLFLLQARSGRAKVALQSAERVQARTFLDASLHAAPEAAPARPERWPIQSATARLDILQSLVPAMSKSPVAGLQPLDAVLSAFGDRHGLVYFEAGDELWLLVVNRRRVSMQRLSATPRVVGELVARLLADPNEAATSLRLGEILLPPGALPAKSSTLYVVADSVLGNLPFAALRIGDRYLVQEHFIVLAPSLNALTAAEEQGPRAYGKAIVLADPRGDLPAAGAEAVAVASLAEGIARIKEAATSAELKRASNTRVLHLATHTGLGPHGSWLRLADRDVDAAEIIAGRIAPRLVVLASCASAVRPGRQMWGSLGAAFLAAGSRAVLASLWSVEDESAREFVVRFYREGGARDPATALARAQRVAIGQGLSPHDWAPYVLQGSGGPFIDTSEGEKNVAAMADHAGPLRSRIRHRVSGEARER